MAKKIKKEKKFKDGSRLVMYEDSTKKKCGPPGSKGGGKRGRTTKGKATGRVIMTTCHVKAHTRGCRKRVG